MLRWLSLLHFNNPTTSDQLWRQEESKGEEVFNYHGRRNPENSNVPSITVPSYFWNTFCIMGFVTTNPLKFPPFHYLIREDFLYIKFRGIEALLSHSRHSKCETKFIQWQCKYMEYSLHVLPLCILRVKGIQYVGSVCRWTAVRYFINRQFLKCNISGTVW